MNNLTDKESEVLNYLTKRYTEKQIAEVMCVSRHAVKTHHKNLVRKLSVAEQLLPRRQ